MATKAVIRCRKCSEEFPIYWNDTRPEKIKCPNCQSELDKVLTNQIMNAIGTVHDVNHELLKAHMEYETPLFEVSICHSAYPSAD